MIHSFFRRKTLCCVSKALRAVTAFLMIGVLFLSGSGMSVRASDLWCDTNTDGNSTIGGSGIWNTNAGTAGTITIQGGAGTIITGRILATGERHSFTKAGSGMLTLSAGSGSLLTFTNNANVNDGTLAIRSISSLNPTSTSAGRVVFVGGALGSRALNPLQIPPARNFLHESTVIY